MQLHVYLSQNKLLIPLIATTVDGINLELEPVEVFNLDANDVQALATLLKRVTDRGNPIISAMAAASFSSLVLPKYAGQRSWGNFAKHAQLWLVNWNESGTRITPTKKGARGAFLHDTAASIFIPYKQEDKIASLIYDTVTKR